MPAMAGIHDRLLADLAADGDDRGGEFLRQAVEFAIADLRFDPDEWVHELVRSVLGFGYPSPNRMQPHLERVAERYVVRFTGSPLDDEHRFDVFATEGGAAAMTYIFTTLQVNGIVGPGDAVAVATPTYTPYLQIPVLERIGFDVVEIQAAAHQPHRFDEGVLDVLRDPRIKVFFLINPGNPDSRAVRPERLDELRQIIQTDRPDLLVVNDTAYANFVEDFHGVTATVPRNVILIHTFSKGYAATGNRLGFIAVHRDSVADSLLRAKPAEVKERLRARYQAASADVDAMPFIQRLLADSREVALHNIAGLSTPNQVQMTLFELAYLMPEGAAYLEGTRAILRERLDALYAGLGIPSPGGTDSNYYGMVNLLAVARGRHGDDLAERIRGTMAPAEVALRLAADSGVIVQTGPSFQGDPWDLRLSLASITTDQAGRIAEAVVALVERLEGELNPR
jgi:aspartate 4-decarboxylase